MGFRRPEETGVTSSRWRLEHQSLLGACGIPAEVASSDRRWIYVLLHAEDHLVTGWQVSWISPQQAANLLAVLERELPASAAYERVSRLRQRSGK